MANWKSTQMTKLDARPKQQLDVQEAGGRLRGIPFSFVAAGVVTGADTIELCEIPAGARMVGGSLVFSAAGASRTVTLGDGTTADKYSVAIDISAAGKADFADTIAHNQDEILGALTTLTATLAGGNLAAADIIRGYVLVQLGS